jgi:acetylornithine deacetylase/succinyl-diaminopimelate desuccinylase-like protein
MKSKTSISVSLRVGLGLVGAAVVFAGAAAAAEPDISFGPYRVTMSLEEARAAAPATAWVESRSKYTGKVVALEAPHAVAFAGQQFDMKLVPGAYGAHAMQLIDWSPDATEAECRRRTFDLTAALDARFGRFEPSVEDLDLEIGLQILSESLVLDREMPVPGSSSRLLGRKNKDGVYYRLWTGVRPPADDFLKVRVAGRYVPAVEPLPKLVPQPGCRVLASLVYLPPRPEFETVTFAQLKPLRAPTIALKHDSLEGEPEVPKDGVDVALDCEVDRTSGRLQRCSPAGGAGSFVKAANARAEGFRFDRATLDPDADIPLHTTLRVDIRPGDRKTLQPPAKLLNMSDVPWTAGPRMDLLQDIYPEKAAGAGMPARIELDCEIEADQSLLCGQVVSDPPLTASESRTARHVLSLYAPAPTMRDGTPSAGTNPKAKALLYICHLDVVAANPADWSLPPFQMTEQDGWIYGRGSLDMKGEDANVAAALIRLKHEGYKPQRDIVVAFTADEEARGEAGVAFLVSQHRDLVDAGVVLNPDSGTPAFREGKRAFYGFQTSEKVFVTFQAETFNKGGHSSEPRPDNAIYELTSALDRLAAYRFPTRLTDTVRAYYAAQGALETGPRKADMLAVGQGDLAAADRLSADPTDNAQVRTTCVATQLSAGHAENALPQRARATIQCRMLPGDTQDQIQGQLAQVFNDPGVKISVITPAKPSPESPPTPAVTATFEKVVHSMWPGLTVMPSMDAGASDSVYTRPAGLPSYGASATFFDLEDMRAHGRDERIKADRFAEGTELAYRLMKAFSGPGAPNI